MVVAQIPLWVLHSNSPPISSASHHLGSSIQSTQSTNNVSRTQVDQKVATQYNLWTNNNADKPITNDVKSDKRSAIYCCDIAKTNGRMATGGGDGKVRIWNMFSLFQTSKNAPGTEDTKDGFDNIENQNNYDDASPKKKVHRMGHFSKTGYESSDSSANNSISSSASDSVSSLQNHHSKTNGTSTPASNAINDLSSLVRKKNNNKGGDSDMHSSFVPTTTEDDVNSKKRKRAATSDDMNGQSDMNDTSTLSSKSKHRLLCTISSHSGSVLTLRFSSNGTYLASAGDDSHILIYKQSSQPCLLSTGNLLSGNNNQNNEQQQDVEYWNRIRILRGHNLDVVGIAWAPDDSHLISCSLDSTTPICVWRPNLFTEKDGGDQTDTSGSQIIHPYKILGKNVHTSTVKGVAFDPAGKYIASSGDDPAICIWRAFDDWGLETRIDASSGIFRKKTKSGTVNSSNGGNDTSKSDYKVQGEEEEEEDIQALASLSLFRRISFAPDGTHVCGTNATLRGKNIAAMIGRDGWGVSTGSNSKNNRVSSRGAANLVGHKQPVVSSRHCPFFFHTPKASEENGKNENISSEDDDDDIEPNYSTLVALGDKRGFVTIWSTRKSRPIFKLQCSESRCTVTDIAWGLLPSTPADSDTQSLILLVSLLDGYVIALKFNILNELGRMLSEKQCHRIFRHKYGIELGSSDDYVGLVGRKRLVDDNSGPKLIENVLQYRMEEDDIASNSENNEGNPGNMSLDFDENLKIADSSQGILESDKPRTSTTVGGKKRIQPTLLTSSNDNVNGVKTAFNDKIGSNKPTNKEKVKQNAIDAAEDAAARAEVVSGKSAKRDNNNHRSVNERPSNIGEHSAVSEAISRVRDISYQSMNLIPPDLTKTTFSIQLQSRVEGSIMEVENDHPIVTCTNSVQSLPASNASSECATLSLSRGGQISWRDQLIGTRCTALAACRSLITVGTYDGSLYFFGTSPSSGWTSGLAFRSHPPFVMSSSITHINIKDYSLSSQSKDVSCQILVVTSDGSFCVYSILPTLKLRYKGSLLPCMNQLRLSSSRQNHTKAIPHPKLERIQITDSKKILAIFSLPADETSVHGGSMQAFVYDHEMEIWTRVSDNKFQYSNFFSTLPETKVSNGLLSRIDQAVKSSFDVRHRRSHLPSSAVYSHCEEQKNNIFSNITKSHCEDRLACALFLKSDEDFQYWLRLYVRQLSLESDVCGIRLLVDVLLSGNSEESSNPSASSWLSSASTILGMNGLKTLQDIVIPEMSKNRSLQRLTNEIATEVNLNRNGL